MRRIFMFSALAGLGVLAACGGATTDEAETAETALTQAVEDAGTSLLDGDAARACLTTFAACVRTGPEEKTCGQALRACIGEVAGAPGGPRPPGDADEGCEPGKRGGPRGGGAGHGDRPPPPDGEGVRPPPPDGEGVRPPPPDGEGDRPPPPDGARPRRPGGGRGPGPKCLGELVTCAKGTGPIEACVDAHFTCVQDAAPTRAAPPAQ